MAIKIGSLKPIKIRNFIHPGKIPKTGRRRLPVNNKVTLAVSAALMSMSMHSAAELSSATESFSVTADQLTAVKATSINKYKNTKSVSTPKTLYTAEKGLENRDYIYFVHLQLLSQP